MKKKLTLITYDLPNALHYRQELLDFFGNIIEIETYTITDGINGSITGDVVLALSPVSNEDILAHCTGEMEIIHGSKLITKAGYEKLTQILSGSKVMLMTTNKTSAFEMATYLYQIGINHIDFLPSFPQNKEIFDVDIAVTPGQTRFIPHYIKQVIDIGWRRIAPDALMSVMVALDLKNEVLLEKLYRSSRDILNTDFSNTTLDFFSRTKELLYLTSNLIDDGILILNSNKTVFFVNDSFLSMLNLKKSSGLTYILPEKLPANLRNLLFSEEEYENEILHFGEDGGRFACSKHAFTPYKEKKGDIIILKDVQKIEKLETEIRRNSLPRTYSAKYTFSDIVGNSYAITKCIKNAKKIAVTEMPVLITGESGTGKELFAQSIHNYSKRFDKPFVALNCAALSKELLESELFGYEEGAFTGAKKGGKKGLFEFAQKGTIFLDEIGDMPMELQAKLLRVLQEREIRRLGGNATIPVDVRIITATNLNLKQMVEEGKFRLDLYYRISMFSLLLPPLRERPEDILRLADRFLAAKRGWKMDAQLSEALTAHSWKGNVRELQNCVEYMLNMGNEVLTVDDLPPEFFDMDIPAMTDQFAGGFVPEVPRDFTPGFPRNFASGFPASAGASSVTLTVPPEFASLFQREQMLCTSIVKLLFSRPMGRNMILKSLNYEYTEHEVKKALDYLHALGYIASSRGRGGTSLTETGKKIAGCI